MTRFLLLPLPFALAGCFGHLDPCSIPCRPGEPCHCVQYSEDGPASFNTPDDNGGPTVDDHGPSDDHNGGDTKDEGGNGSSSEGGSDE